MKPIHVACAIVMVVFGCTARLFSQTTRLSQLSPPGLPAMIPSGLDFAHATVAVDSAHAGMPVLLWVSVPNTSNKDSISYLTGMGEYLQAQVFQVKVTLPAGPRSLQPYNGQWPQGRTTPVTVKPGRSLRTPLAIDPLPAGTYDAELLRRFDSRPDSLLASVTHFRIDVVDAADAQARWIDQRVQEYREGSWFAPAVCLKYHIEPVIDAMLADLAGGDVARIWNAADRLRQYTPRGKMPDKWSTAVSTALAKAAERVAGPRSSMERASGAVVQLAWLVDPQPQFLEPILAISRSANLDARDAAIMALQSYRRPAASDRLAEVVAAGDGQTFIAAHALVNRGDDRGIKALADESLRSPRPPLFEVLVMYPDNPRASAAIANGLNSRRPEVVKWAQSALHPEYSSADPLDRRPPPPEIAKLSTQDAMKILLDAQEFAVIDEAAAANAPTPAIAVRMVNTRSGSYAAASHLYHSGTLYSRLYAMCIAYYASDGTLEEMADGLRAEINVTVIDGSKQISMPLSDVVARIVSGEYPGRMMRHYPSQK